MAKPIVISLKTIGNWQARYLSQKFFIIISTCCAHHVVHFILVLGLIADLISHFD